MESYSKPTALARNISGKYIKDNLVEPLKLWRKKIFLIACEWWESCRPVNTTWQHYPVSWMSYDNGETFESALAWGPYSNDDMKFIWIELCFSWLCKDTYSSELESQGTDRQWNTNTKPWSDVCNVHCYSSRWKFKCGWSCVKKETHTGISTREKLLYCQI